MGSASSKVARASAKKPSWSGARVAPRTRQPWASESKDEEIQRDAKDPQLLANLGQLGQVQVHHHKLTSGTESKGHDHVKELFESRKRAEHDAASASTPRNRLHVSSLVALLEERQDASSASQRQLAEKYGMDVERLESLARSVNVPSVVREDRGGGGGGGGGGGVRYVRDAESGEDIAVTEVEWREPTTLRDGH